MYHSLKNYFGRTRWYSYVMRLEWKVGSVHLETVQILTQDRCTVCVERTIGLKIVLGAPNATLGEVGHVESCFFYLETVLVSVQDRCVVCVRHTIGS
jgi:hypothetical protein